jgi:predicted lysophospholipase L1 biosynthesis ABC-type transport system permease subunit
LRELRKIEPIEAVRPAETLRRAFKVRIGKASYVVIVLAALAFLVGFLRPTESMINSVEERLGTIAVVIFSILLGVGVFVSPLTPLISLYEGSKILAASNWLDRFARAIVRLASSNGISMLGEASGERIKSALLSFIRAGILGVGLSFGTLMATYGFDSVLRPWLLSSPSTTGSTSMSATLSSIDNNIQIFYFIAIVSAIATGLIVLSSVATLFNAIKRQVAVMRARGARGSDVLRYVYSSFLHTLTIILLGGFILSLVIFYSIDTVVSVSFIDKWSEGGVPHLIPGFTLHGLIIGSSLVLFIILSPLIVSLKIMREKDIGKLLREEV